MNSLRNSVLSNTVLLNWSYHTCVLLYFFIAGLVDWVVNSGHLKQNSASGDRSSDGDLSTSNKVSEKGSVDDSVDEPDNIDSEESPVRVIKKKRRDIPAEEKKICLWVLEDGTACGKTFTKFDR